jgi:putative ABC transport system permease protein
MIKNYVTVALRALVRNKLSAFINIFGLALAISCSLLIYLFIRDELSFDQYNAKSERIYRVTRNFLSPDGSVSLHLGHVAPPFGPLLENDFADFEEVVRTLQSRFLLAYEDGGEIKKTFNEDNTFYAEPEIFKVFSIDVLKGNPEKALSDPFSIMLSEKTAEKYFGDEEAIGKTLKVGNQFNYTVTGIFKDLPAQSHWHPALLASFSTLNDSTIYGRKGLEQNWGNNSFGTYILARHPLDISTIEKLFPAFIDKHMGFMAKGGDGIMPSKWTNLFLQKVTDIHLHSNLDSEVEANGSMAHVYMMGVIAIFIVLIACFNFVNLSTARASKRAKEVGLRKVVGAFKSQLIGQYLSESIIIALFALVVAVGFSFTTINWLNDFTHKSIQLTFFSDQTLASGLLLFTIIIGMLAGIYPAFVISGFKPAMILKGQQGSARGKGNLRKFLVVLQFSISIILVVATLITFRQLQFLNNRDLGYNKDQVVLIRYYNEADIAYDAFFNELTKHSSIKGAGRSNIIPTGRLLNSQGTALVQKGDTLENTNIILKNVNIDYDFFETYEIPIIAGRNFSKANVNDDSLSFILNESALQMIGMTADEMMSKDFQYGGVTGRVIGVVKDFHFESLHEKITPVVFQAQPRYSRISVKLSGQDIQSGISHLEKVWKQFLPSRPFEYTFLNEQYQQLYEAEQRQAQLFTLFACMAILIACLGLFGLATFNTMQRVKEIGIRKVLGASVFSIVRLLSTEIMVLILIANVVAWPIAWYLMDKWLDTFAYKIDLQFGLYALAGLLAISIGLLTVSVQTVKAARSNPANTLRYE